MIISLFKTHFCGMKWISRNETPIGKVMLVGNEGLIYDSLHCKYTGTSYVLYSSLTPDCTFITIYNPPH
jgi:hypothetical protein